jgi:hypothetical protein
LHSFSSCFRFLFMALQAGKRWPTSGTSINI